MRKGLPKRSHLPLTASTQIRNGRIRVQARMARCGVAVNQTTAAAFTMQWAAQSQPAAYIQVSISEEKEDEGRPVTAGSVAII
jgi:hypothetical protein